MTTRILFIQGGGAGTYDDWDSKLVASLQQHLGPGFDIRYPRMPDEDNPDFMRWSDALHREMEALDDGALLVAHSLGATILAHALARQPPRRAPAGIFLIAMPFIGRGGWPSDEIEADPDLGAKLPAQSAVYLYQGAADDIVPSEHLQLNAKAIPQAVARMLPGRDHQLNNDLSAVAADIRDVIGRKPS